MYVYTYFKGNISYILVLPTVHFVFKNNQIHVLLGKTCARFNEEKPTTSGVIHKINMKCVEARRGKRVHSLMPKTGTTIR